MDEAFFIASKTIGHLTQVESWLVIGMGLSLVAVWRGRRGWALTWGGLVLAATLALTAYPLGNPLMAHLETQYPQAPDLGPVDGIIVLGGAEDLGPYFRWGGLEMNEAGERLVAGVELARRFPQAKLIYTGGTAGLFANPRAQAPSDMVKAFWLQMGVPEAQIVIEDRSRDTWENAVFSKAIVLPQSGQHYLLVTSAWHMPRAMQSFARAGWQGLTAWPVDYRSRKRTFEWEWHLDAHLVELDTALKEELGLLAYRLAGKS